MTPMALVIALGFYIVIVLIVIPTLNRRKKP